ncbi:hypothetical protein KGO95_01390 [Patescibacteria group bacterium]|nr:hypothetical protein [Patescibacteria group bacterium]
MRSGQSIVEVLVALGIGALVLTGIGGAYVVSVRTNEFNTKSQSATIVNNSLGDEVRSFSGGNWPDLYALTTGSANTYHLTNTGGVLASAVGPETVTVNNISFTRSFYVDPVSRTAGLIDATYSSSGDDPYTRKVTVTTSFPVLGAAQTVSTSFYVTRWQSFAVTQTDWSNGSGQAGPITRTNGQFFSSANVNYTGTPGSILPSLTTCNAASEQCEVVSSTYDTQETNGAGYNYFIWQGTQPSGSKVGFEIATSNSSGGPWSYGSLLEPAGPNVQVPIPASPYINARYFRYKIIFDTANATPQVDSVSIGLSK